MNPTKQDPFVSVVIPPPTPPAVVLPPVLPPPEPVKAPALAYRYLGQFVEPGGKRLVYLVKGDREVPVAAGTQLEDGYVVEAITANAVKVLHAATQTRADIVIAATKESP